MGMFPGGEQNLDAFEGLRPCFSPEDEEEVEPEDDVFAVKKEDPAGEDVIRPSLPLADNFEKASNVSGKLGGVAGVFAGVII